MDVRIEYIYQTAKGVQTTFTSETMRVAKAILLAEDIEKTGRVKEITFIDDQDSTWTIKDLRKYMKGIETEAHDVTVYFDGGFDIDTYTSGLGCAIYYQQNGKSYRLRKNALVKELNTNNEAEYAALHLAIQELEFLGVHHMPVTFIGDSQVVVNQLTGDWPCVEEELNRWADRIETKLEALGITPEYRSVSRKKNREADHLASQALNETEITSTIELNQ
ncbi:ribonuclease H family protein [Aquibacillus koreensis]|uniref:Ribonuclease H family protein n=1 Tax=Aquibacillus koreensis TaxID=279446 RepID=A0A9X3WLM1_9BACI|nr:ribonuclease H family protein [Aquibacillus koreensis]MCT2536914.1 ribonuclease H family protein [Aquibacillus koreensis]MDC3421955.1 ribonuclease H family protein [Aquibacillus koreensis]